MLGLLVIQIFSAVLAWGCPDLHQQACGSIKNDDALVTREITDLHLKAKIEIPQGNVGLAGQADYVRYLEKLEGLVFAGRGTEKELQDLFLNAREQVALAVQDSKNLNSQDRQAMMVRLGRTRLLLPSQLASGFDPDESSYALLMACGFNTPFDNAFALTDSNVLVVCPARILRIMMAPPQERGLRSLRGLAHEIGHMIDSGNFESVYRDWLNCVKGRLTDLKPPLNQYDSEISADYWAFEVLSRALKPSLSFQKDFSIAVADLCHKSAAGVQLSGDARINKIYSSVESSPAVCGTGPSSCRLR